MPALRRFVQGTITWHSDLELIADGILIAFSERTGGRSLPPYATLNMSDRVGDDPATVKENRHILMSALGLDSATQEHLHWCIQTHGTRVARVDEPVFGGVLPDTDALITATSGIPLLVCVADCVPIILATRTPRRALAVVHSGWKGTLARISAEAVTALRDAYGVKPADVRAYIGPYIGPESFEIAPEVAARFAAEFPALEQTPSGNTDEAGAPTLRLDLGAAVAQTLQDSGVPADQIAALGEDTAQDRAHYYSYRAQNGATGRQAALACLLPQEGERVHA
ncbi:MAG: peptidoglycan editing factor PgeF [Actinomycetia bacterium]|nr:peptidoglycan editing factor PgeF [Actinomycetes bacterium]